MDYPDSKNEQRYNNIRNECHTNAIHCFATAHIFEYRAKKYKNRIKAVEFFGVAVPLIIGGTAAAYGAESKLLHYLLYYLAAPSTIILLILSALSLVYQWSDKLSYSYEALIDNSDLAKEYKLLGSSPPPNFTDLNLKFNVLKTKDESRTRQDNMQNIRNKEDRRGMRKALRQYQIPCAGCGDIPISMKPTDCDVCGNF